MPQFSLVGCLVAFLLLKNTFGLLCFSGNQTKVNNQPTEGEVLVVDCNGVCCIVDSLQQSQPGKPPSTNTSNQFFCNTLRQKQEIFEVVQPAIEAELPSFTGQPSLATAYCCCAKGDHCNKDTYTCSRGGAMPVSPPPKELAVENTGLTCKVGEKNGFNKQPRSHQCEGACCLTNTSLSTAIFSCNKMLLRPVAALDFPYCCCTGEDNCNEDMARCMTPVTKTSTTSSANDNDTSGGITVAPSMLLTLTSFILTIF